MSIREDMNEIRNEVMEVKKIRNEVMEVKGKKNQSLAREMLEDYKKQNKLLCVIIILILLMWFATGCYLVYILNDIGTIEETSTQEITDVDSIDSSNIVNGDMNGKDKTN